MGYNSSGSRLRPFIFGLHLEELAKICAVVSIEPYIHATEKSVTKGISSTTV